MSIYPPIRVALTTCDDIFGAGGVGTSITRIARGLSTNHNARVDILMLNSNQHAEFNPRGRNGIIKLDHTPGQSQHIQTHILDRWIKRSATLG